MHAAVLNDVVEELAAGKLENHDDLGGRLDYGIQLDDVRMAQQLQVLDLPLNASLHVARLQVLAGDDLEGDLLAGSLVNGQLHLAEAAFAQSLDDLVLAQSRFATTVCAMRRLLAILTAASAVAARRGGAAVGRSHCGVVEVVEGV